MSVHIKMRTRARTHTHTYTHTNISNKILQLQKQASLRRVSPFPELTAADELQTIRKKRWCFSNHWKRTMSTERRREVIEVLLHHVCYAGSHSWWWPKSTSPRPPSGCGEVLTLALRLRLLRLEPWWRNLSLPPLFFFFLILFFLLQIFVSLTDI